jgi:uncharacterized membrane protein YgcG
MGALKTTARVLACLLLFGQARASALTLTLAWDPSTDPHVVGYLLSYGTASGSYTTQLDAGNSSSMVVANLDDHTTYYFTIQSYDIGQQHVSTRSGEVVYSPLSVMCLNASGASSDGNPVAVTIPAPVVSGAAPPLTVSCAPASGSAFPVGSTSFTCTVMDVVMSAACTGTVSVADNSGSGGGGGGGGGSTPGGGGGGSSSGGGSPAPSDPAPATGGGAPAADVVADGPIYETPPPPGSFGFSDHGYFRPDGGWQETRRLSMGGGGAVVRAIGGGGGCVPAAGVPVYEMPAPPGSSGFSDHGYYRPDGGWQETRQIAGASGSTCVPYTGGYSGSGITTPSSPSIAAMPSDYDTPPPPGSYGFTDRGYFRPDGGWQSANRMRTGGVAVYSGAPSAASVGSSTGGGSSMAYGGGGSVTYASAPAPAPSAYISAPAPAPRATTAAIAPINMPSPMPAPAPSAPVQINVPAPATRIERSGEVSSVRQPEQRAISVGVMLPRPAAPANATPVDTALTPRSFDASWSADQNAESYDIYLGVNPEPPLFKSGVTSSVVSIQGLAPNTTYYWRVVARNGAGETASGTWTFTTRDR